MLYWLIMLGLLVHNSSALIFGDEEENLLWRRGGPSIMNFDDNKCKKDILVIWDNSQSVGKGPFTDNIKPFLKNLIESPKLNVGEQGTQFGFITFSSKEQTKTLLNIGEKKTPAELEAWLDSLDYDDLKGPWTYTGEAFKIAKETFSLKSPLNHRPEIADVILLLTDGEPRAKKNTLITVQENLAEACSASLKDDKGVKIIGLAVGSPGVLRRFLHFIEKWSSKDSVFSARKDELDKVLDGLVAKTCIDPGNCICTKTIDPFKVYAGPGEQSARVTWPEPGAKTTKRASACERGTVDPPGSASGKRYPLGPHVINYRFSNGAKNPKFANCPVKFTVVPCRCPQTQTVKGRVTGGKKTVRVTWKEPEPDCPTLASPHNPRTSEYFSVGKYTRTYKYSYNQPGSDSFELECRVNISIAGEICDKMAFDPARQVCCCGVVWKKKNGYQCCGKNYHNMAAEKCCDSQRAIVVPIKGNCP